MFVLHGLEKIISFELYGREKVYRIEPDRREKIISFELYGREK